MIVTEVNRKFLFICSAKRQSKMAKARTKSNDLIFETIKNTHNTFLLNICTDAAVRYGEWGEGGVLFT
jgi:hypothetical protein